MDIKGGWKLEEDFGIYRIPLRITNPETQTSIIKNCLFDTGFSGYLGLDENTITELNLKNIGIGKGYTVQGIIDYQNFEGLAEIIDDQLNPISTIHELDSGNEKEIIPIQEFNIPILGIKSIRQLSWLILAERDAIFIIN